MTHTRRRSFFFALLSIVLAACAFTLWGYIWYATLLDDVWQNLISKSEAELIVLAEMRGNMQTLFTHLISGVQATALYLLIHLSHTRSLSKYLGISLIAGGMIAAPVLGNSVLFAGTPPLLWVLDTAHFVLGYLGMASIIWAVQTLTTPPPSQQRA